MPEQKYLYFLLLLASLSIPLLRSFEKRIAYYKSFYQLFTAIIIVGGLFILWDIVFTALGYWGFNPRYISGVYFFGLPFEEILFFVVIPFCSIFIYRVTNFFIRRDFFGPYSKHISRFLYGFGFTMSWMFHDRSYTFTTFLFLSLLLVFLSEVQNARWLGRFYLSYLLILIPFFVVNGVLTGMWIEDEVVWYNSLEFTGFRIITIPFEDVFYGMLLILSVVTIYEKLGYTRRTIYESETE